MPTYRIPCRLEFQTDVDVEADSAAEALKLFNAGKWDTDVHLPELVNWEAVGTPVLDE